MARVKQIELDIYENSVENDEEYSPPAGFPYSPPEVTPCSLSALDSDDEE